MKYFPNKINILFSFLFIFGTCPLIAFSQEVDLCKGIQYVSKSLGDPETLKKLDDYGKVNMGFESSFGDHPYMKNYERDKTRGRYNLRVHPKTADEAKKTYDKYYDQLKKCFGASTGDSESEIGKSAKFESKGLSIDLMLLIDTRLFDNTPTYSIYIMVVENKSQ